jgi:hypothetical protein
MTKILVTTINVNQPELTNNLVEELSKDTRVDFELMVLENGATERSKYSTHVSEKNYFYGGGLNLIFDYYLNETSYDWLMVLNNDLLLHGQRFLSTMLHEAETHDMCTLSPAIINASISQCYWKQMHNWMTGGVRQVDWVDFQAPLLRRDICEVINAYPTELIYGWGNDILTGMIAEEHNLKTGVTDKVCITHLNSQTMEKGVVDLEDNPITTREYCARAETNMFNYMQTTGRWDKFLSYRDAASSYTYTSIK